MEHPYRSAAAPLNEREDEAFAALSARIVRARSLIAAAGAIGGLAAGVGLYLVADAILVAHFPYYTMSAAMLVAFGLAFVGARALARRYVAMRMPRWVAALAAQFTVEPRRLLELSSIWAPSEDELPAHIARQRRNP